jgi:hypothetical protein
MASGPVFIRLWVKRHETADPSNQIIEVDGEQTARGEDGR